MKPYYDQDGIQIYHGDALEVMPQLAAVDAVVTDPPFGVRGEEWDNMDPQEFARFSMAWLSQSRRLSPEMIVFCTAGSAIEPLSEMIYPRVRRMVWHKPSGSQYAGASERGMWFAHETILHCHAGIQLKERRTADVLRSARKRMGLSLGAIDIAVRGKKTGLAYRWEEAACLPTKDQCDILKPLLGLDGDLDAALALDRLNLCDSASASDVFTHRTITDIWHPCEKPVPLINDLLGSALANAKTLLDPFGGSGSTAVAAKEMGRTCILIEENERYCEIAAKRLAQGVLFGTGAA